MFYYYILLLYEFSLLIKIGCLPWPWLNDEFLVSESRDTSLALWKIPDPVDTTDCNFANVERERPLDLSNSQPSTSSQSSNYLSSVPSYSYINAVAVKQCKSPQKVRDIVFNRKLQEIACVSLNGYIHIWSADRFVQVRKTVHCIYSSLTS